MILRRMIPALLLLANVHSDSIACEAIDFDRQIVPLLVSRCLDCHNSSDRKGELDLTESKAALRELERVILPGNAVESRLWQQVNEEVMPPEKPLSDSEKSLLRLWIDQGAKWGSVDPINRFGISTEHRAGLDFWSLQPVVRPEIPGAGGSDWARNPIDYFVLEKLREKKLEPAGPANRHALIRRVTFDLIGLPPTPQEIDEFVHDTRPDAYMQLVDRLLASKHYGERWARHWLDIARYTESQGFEYDRFRPNAWPYRDYVIDALNTDKPYDIFLQEQLAGDVFNFANPKAELTEEGIIATSLLVCGPWDQAGNSQKNVTQKLITREEELEDLVSVIGQSILGMTINCARCHAHKFDPIPHEDYYRFKAVFEGIKHGERSLETPTEEAARQQQLAPLEKARNTIDKRIAELESQARARAIVINKANDSQTTDKISAARDGPQISREQMLSAMSDQERAQYDSAVREASNIRAEIKLIPPPRMAYVGLRQQPEPTARLIRGDVTNRAEVVNPAPLSAIRLPSGGPPLQPDAPESERRIQLARWLSDPQQPLTARVLVNRLWHYHVGRGIVETPNDFGFNGARPTHPELLDWLAAEFVSGPQPWSIKHMHRLIVSSATYRQAATFNPQAAAMDADNTLLWRYAPRRLEGEIIRDAMLAVSGELNPALGGPSFMPFIVTKFNSEFYQPIDPIGPEFNRRTIYRANINSGKSAMLDALDCPDPSIKTPTRRVTTTPLAALALMNNSFVLRQAHRLAERAWQQSQGQPAESIRHAYLTCFGRPATDAEVQTALTLVKEQSFEAVCWALLNASEFMYVN